jgi:3-oxoacyl-[acyl-carrier-protein] synthase II
MCELALTAAREAIGDDIAFFRSSLGGLRLAISIGTSKGGIQHFGRFVTQVHKHARPGSGASALRALQYPLTVHLLRDIPPDSAARAVAEMIGLPACVHATVGACTTGTLAFIRGAQLIADGEADLVICGGADASIHPLWLAAFHQMGALAAPHPTLGPGYACQPYDRERRGFAVGEGAGILILESPRSTRVRSSIPLARVAGSAVLTDVAGLTQLTESGETLARAARRACARAAVNPADLVCVHAHGTGTRSNDLTEARAFADVLAERSRAIPVVSPKGAMGHLLGAAGAVEIALAVLACRHGESFANTTLVEPDPALQAIHTPHVPFSIPPGPILKTSMGFGGHVAAVILTPQDV